jgi:uncharacterized membrane protein
MWGHGDLGGTARHRAVFQAYRLVTGDTRNVHAAGPTRLDEASTFLYPLPATTLPDPNKESARMTEPASPGAVSSNRNIMIVLSYLWLLALVPLLVEKQDREVQWHAKHGIVLMVAEIVLWILVTIITTLIGFVSVALGCVVSLLTFGLWIAILVVHVMAIIKGINGGRFLIPGVSEYANRF